MEADVSRQILSLQNDLNVMKSALTPAFQLLQEIQEIRKKHHVSQAYNVSNISIIALEIKEEILKDVTSMQIKVQETIEDFKEEVKSTISDKDIEMIKLKDEIFTISVSQKENSTVLNTFRHSLGESGIYIKEIKRELEEKANFTNIDELRQVLKTMTPLSAFEILKNRVSECSSVYQVQDLQKKVEVQRQKLKNYMKVLEVEKKLKEFSANLSKDFNTNFISFEKFSEQSLLYSTKFNELDQDITSSKDYFNKLDNSTNEKVRILKKNLESKP